ncbi:MAG: hypothetical protein EBY21_02855 [Alphaproteobacteria bacterium]|nr:hypothetical protein [Alphaproteobacteria bacterium]
MILGLIFRQTFIVPCTLTIEHSADSLHAHVDIDGDVEIRPGDEVLVHDAPTLIAFGERLRVKRQATIIRASLIERLWTKIAALFEMNELFEVSFTERRIL